MRILRIILSLALLACPLAFTAYSDCWRFVRCLHALQLRNSFFSSLPDSSFCFSYDADPFPLSSISRHFNLDSLTSSCDGSSWSRSLAIAQFVSSNIPHDNQDDWPSDYSAIGLWQYAESHPSGFNCRLHACLLHDLLLSAGIANRITTCLPKDTADSRCHVVNLVWLPELDKWAMIDSDANFWVSSVSDSVPLDVIEIRTALANGDALSPHSLADSDCSLSGDRYLAFLSQNFFWFSCREDCGLSADSSANRAVCLAPMGYICSAAKYYPCHVVTSSAESFLAAPDL